MIAESIPVDHFLAKKFNLLGNNEWEEYTIKALYNNIHHLRERSFTRMTFAFWDRKQEGFDYHLKTILPNFIANHEFHLRANGSNGHYLGDKVSSISGLSVLSVLSVSAEKKEVKVKRGRVAVGQT